MTKKIAVYGICKDEVGFIERAVTSAIDADYQVWIDTGSTDGTLEKLLELAGKLPCPIMVQRISVQPWRFDDARNVALSLVPSWIEVCVSLDADEILNAGWRQALDVAPTADRYNHRFTTHWNWLRTDEQPTKSEHWHERIHVRSGYVWRLPVHEVLVRHRDGTPEKVEWLPELGITQLPDTTKNRGSYLKLLQQAVKEPWSNWKTYTFYAGELDAVDVEQATLAWAKSLEFPDTDKGYIYATLAEREFRIYGATPAYAAHAYSAATFGNIREYHLKAALAAKRTNNLTRAKLHLDDALRCVVKTSGYAYEAWAWDDAKLAEFVVRINE